jgi:hypothetical protein
MSDFVPKADDAVQQKLSLLDDLVGPAKHGVRNSEAERAWHSCVSIYAL